MTASAHRHGILLMVASMLLFSLMGVCIRYAGETVPAMQMVFFRNLICLLMRAS